MVQEELFQQVESFLAALGIKSPPELTESFRKIIRENCHSAFKKRVKKPVSWSKCNFGNDSIHKLGVKNDSQI